VTTKPATPKPGATSLEAALLVDRAKPRTPSVESEVSVTATGQFVLFLSGPEEQKLRFQGEKPLRCASRLLPPGSRKVAGPVSAPPTPSRALVRSCGPRSWLVRKPAQTALPPSTRNRTGGRPRQQEQRVSEHLREKQKHRNSLRRPVAAVAALVPVCGMGLLERSATSHWPKKAHVGCAIGSQTFSSKLVCVLTAARHEAKVESTSEKRIDQ
jgi:hypothetical protein